MAADMFDKTSALNLLLNRDILFFGDSNIRALYKDTVWLLENGTLIPDAALKQKNEICFSGDSRISDARSSNCCSYQEKREYNRHGVRMQFEFLTRIYQERLEKAILQLRRPPSVLVLNSCLWDISRYGNRSIEEFKKNLTKTLKFLRSKLPVVKIIWITTLPPSPKCRGGFMKKDMVFMQSMLPFHVVEANNHVIKCLKDHFIDILDFHYHFRLLIDYRSPDGIHWQPKAVRYMSNLLLTHLAICWSQPLPNYYPISGSYREDYLTSNDPWNFLNNNNNNNSNNMSAINRRIRNRKRRLQRRSAKGNSKNKVYPIDFTLDIHP